VNINSGKKVSILIFASGNGSNAENIITYFRNKTIDINWMIITNNANAGVIQRSKKMGVPFLVFNKEDFHQKMFLEKISSINPKLIILAGFLLKIPRNLIKKFNNKIINIHPSLLPKYGGKGMYGMNVHNEVIKNKEDQSGISIHYVNNQYDEGEIIFQKSTKIVYPSSAEELSKKIHELEMKYFPEIIEKLINSECYE
jgi:phosphoribosylglycinamide formyltransferase-1